MAGYRVGTECIPCFNCTHPPAFSPVEPIFKLQLHQLPGNLPKALRTHNAFVLSGSTRYSKDTSTEKCRKSCKACKSHFSKRQQDNNNLKTTTTKRLLKKKLCYQMFLSTWEWNPWCPEVFSLKTSVHVLNADPLSSPACSCILYDCSLPKFYPRHSFVLCGLRALAKVFPAPISTQMCKVHARDANAVFHHFMRIKPELKEVYLKI